MEPKIQKLKEDIALLLQEKADREAALPAHSIRPHQLLIIEELEEKIASKQAELEHLRSKS